jgi:bacterial surface protein 26-residue repeat
MPDEKVCSLKNADCDGLPDVFDEHIRRHETNMDFMFYQAHRLSSVDVSHFNTSNVTTMQYMFAYCDSLTILDLRSFNTSNVRGIYEMFNGCSSLVTIKVGRGWTTSSVTNNYNPYIVFQGCTSLVGGKGTVYNSRYVDKSYAHIDGGPDNPGYLTDASAPVPSDLNGDGSITIGDVTILIDLLLSGGTINNEAADVNLDGNVSIGDVTTLIDKLLSSN